MKYLQLQGLSLLLFFICASTSAQNKIPINEPDLNKPKLFASLPDKIPVDISSLQSLLNAENGKEVSLKLGQNTLNKFNGTIISKVNTENINSVVIRSGNFNGATFTLSSSTQPNGTVKFTGRIISFQHGDLYELQNQTDQYLLIKKNFYDLVNE
jgi:hypothetical protein